MKRVQTMLHFILLTVFAWSSVSFFLLMGSLSGKSCAFSWICAGVASVVAWGGMGLRVLIGVWFPKKPKPQNLTLYGMTLLIGLLGAWLLPLDSWFLKVIGGLVYAGVLFGGARLLLLPFEKLYHPYVYTGVALWHVFWGVVWKLMVHQAGIWQIILMLILVTVLFAVANNAGAMQYLVQGKTEKTLKLPTEIRKSNRLCMLIFLGIGLCLILFTKPLASGICYGLTQLLSGIVMLMHWLSHVDSGEEIEETATETQQSENVSEQINQYPWIYDVVCVLMIGLLLFLLIRFRKEIGQAVSNWIHGLITWIRKKLYHEMATQERGESGAYCDYVEELQSVPVQAEKLQSPRQKKRQWNRLYREFQRQTDGIERYRLGYQLLLCCLPQEVECCTVQEICVMQQDYPELWEAVSNLYDQVRYGEISVSEFDSLEKLVELYRI